MANAGHTPQTIGPYRVLRELGRGAFGAVYLAQRDGDPTCVAIKVLLEPDPEQVIRFKREGTLGAKVDHPGAVDVIDTGLVRGMPYLVMEYCKGPTLREALRTGGPLEPRDAAELVHQIAIAVAAAHAERVIHRDLKPENVILDANAGGRPRVTDFGLARDAAKHVDRLTRTGDVMGTPAYMAPELFEDAKGSDARVDVYALGALLYECLTGQTPHQGRNWINLANKVLNESIRPPAALVPGIPNTLNGLCMRALARDVTARTPTAEALVRELGSFLVKKEPRTDPHPRNPVVVALTLATLMAIGCWGVTLLVADAVVDPDGDSAAESVGEAIDGAPPPETTGEGRGPEAPATPTASARETLEQARTLAVSRAPDVEVFEVLDAAKALTTDPTLRTEIELERALHHQRRGSFAEAAKIADALEETRRPLGLHVRWVRARAYQKRPETKSLGVAQLQALRELDPAGEVGLNASALLAIEEGDVARARALIARAKAHTATLAVLLTEVRVHLKSGHFLQARDALDRLKPSASHHVRFHELRVEITSRLDAPEDTLRALDALDAASAEVSSGSSVNRARLHLLLKRFDDAQRGLESASLRFPENVAVAYTLGLVYQAAKKHAAARVAYRRALGLDNGAVAAMINSEPEIARFGLWEYVFQALALEGIPLAPSPRRTASLTARVEGVDEPAARAALLEALQRSSGGARWTEFRGPLQRAADAAPNSLPLLMAGTQLALGRGEFRAADLFLARARSLNPPPSPLRRQLSLLLADASARSGDTRMAGKLLDILVQAAPDTYEADCARAWRLSTTNPAESLRLATKALSRAPERNRAQFQRMVVLMRSKTAWIKAIAEADAIIAKEGLLNSRLVAYRSSLVGSYFRLHDRWDLAHAEYERALSLSNKAETRVVIVQGLSARDGEEQLRYGLTLMKQALEFEETHPTAHMSAARLLLALGSSPDQILAHWRRAEELQHWRRPKPEFRADFQAKFPEKRLELDALVELWRDKARTQGREPK